MNPFEIVDNWLQNMQGDIKDIAITLFTIGIMVTGSILFFGGEEKNPIFKKAFAWLLIGLIVMLLAGPIVTWVDTSLG